MVWDYYNFLENKVCTISMKICETDDTSTMLCRTYRWWGKKKKKKRKIIVRRINKSRRSLFAQNDLEICGASVRANSKKRGMREICMPGVASETWCPYETTIVVLVWHQKRCIRRRNLLINTRVQPALWNTEVCRAEIRCHDDWLLNFGHFHEYDFYIENTFSYIDVTGSDLNRIPLFASSRLLQRRYSRGLPSISINVKFRTKYIDMTLINYNHYR